MDIESFDSEELLALARHDLERGELAGALEKLKAIVAKKKPPADAIVMVARVYARLGLFEKAQEYYRKYVDLNPKAFHETFELGMTYFDKGQVDEALSFWDKVLKADPTYPPALFYSGLALARAGNATDARRNLDVLMKSAPADNLYFEKAKELIRNIESGAPTAPVAALSSPPVSGSTPYGRQ